MSQVDSRELYALAGIMKAAIDSKQLEKLVGSSYPDYNRALVTQNRRSPTAAGVTRGLQGGGVGAILGALVARLLSKDPKHLATGAALGGTAGGLAGYHSGKRQAESDYSRLLFLRRRLGINEPGELEAMLKHPEILAASIQERSRG